MCCALCFSSMAEIERTKSPHDFLEVMETSDINLSLMSETENLSDDVILISPLSPPLASLPALEQHQLWMDTDCEVSSTGELSKILVRIYRVSFFQG